MTEGFCEEYVCPSLYELSWSREGEFPQISIPRVVVDHILVPYLPMVLAKHKPLFTKRKLDLSDYREISKKDPWGFGETLLPTEVLFPGYLSWKISFSKESPFDFSVTMYLIFRILNPFLSQEEGEKLGAVTELPPKQVEISSVGFERGGAYLSVNVYRAAEGWLQMNSGQQIPSISEAMRVAYKTAYGEFETCRFIADITEDGRAWQTVPGQNCSLGARNKESTVSGRPIIEMTEHNMDSPDQQYSHFAGIAAMADEIRRFNTK